MRFDYFYGTQPEQYQFYKLPKLLVKMDAFHSVSMDAKVLYSMMLDRASLSAENGWLDEEGRVYIIYTVREVCKDIRCGLQKAVKLLKELDEESGLIRRKKQGLGKPDLIYVMNFATGLWMTGDMEEKSGTDIETAAFRKSKCQSFENQNTTVLKTETPEFRKSKPNKTDSNQTENSNTDPISSDGVRENHPYDHPIRIYLGDSESIAERDVYIRYIAEQLDVPLLLEKYPYEEGRIREIIELLADICSGESGEIRIGQTLRPYAVVKSRLMSLTHSHICYVLQCMAENRSDVRNIRQYLLTALYNAPVTMNHYYQAKVNHDMAIYAAGKEGDEDRE